MNYNYKIPKGKIETTGLPKALLYSTPEDMVEQIILLEHTQFNLAVVVPENVILFSGKTSFKYIEVPDFSAKRKAFIVPKNNHILVREICNLFNNEDWKKECIFPIPYKDEDFPRSLGISQYMGTNGNYSIDVAEYSDKYIVLFAPLEFKDKIPQNFHYLIKYQEWIYFDGSKAFGFGITKQAPVIPKVKEIVNFDFEALYKSPISNNTMHAPMPISSPGSAFSKPAPSVASVIPKASITTDIISLFSKINNSSEREIKNITDTTLVITGNKDKVEETLSLYPDYQLIMECNCNSGKTCKYIKINIEEI